MRNSHTVIHLRTAFEIVSDDTSTTPVEGNLTYDSRDPYALRVSFRTDISTTIDWLFARDLLRDGLTAPAGTGDVRIEPTSDNLDQLRFEFSSPCGYAALVTCANTLENFLYRTLEAVPEGAEYSAFDFELALSELLDGLPRGLWNRE
ncbi:MAG: SsgA family sporulation/cell division regulator [Actinobacteria bacterium]|nr:SsgA family sporulation/cell division regulator [Actinomycetota bacterium]